MLAINLLSCWGFVQANYIMCGGIRQMYAFVINFEEKQGGGSFLARYWKKQSSPFVGENSTYYQQAVHEGTYPIVVEDLLKRPQNYHSERQAPSDRKPHPRRG